MGFSETRISAFPAFVVEDSMRPYASQVKPISDVSNSAGSSVQKSSPQLCILEKPLVLRVCIVRRPEFFGHDHVSIDSITDESDILFGTTSPCSRHSSSSCPGLLPALTELVEDNMFGLEPTMCLPPSVESYYEGEVFRILLCITNVTDYSVKEVEAEVDAVGPSKERISLARQKFDSISPCRAFTRVVELPLGAVGKHRVEIKCACVDPPGNARVLTWNSTITVLSGVGSEISAIGKRVSPVRAPSITATSPVETLLHNIRMEEDVFAVEARLLNRTSSFLSITQCFLDLQDDTPYHVIEPSHKPSSDFLKCGNADDNCGMTMPRPKGNFFRHVYGDDYPGPTPVKFTSLPFSLAPGGVIRFIFHIGLPISELRCVPRKPVGSNIVGNISSSIRDLGTVHWSWERHKGDGGCGRSNKICLRGFVSPPSIDLKIPKLYDLSCLTAQHQMSTGCTSNKVEVEVSAAFGCARLGKPLTLKGFVIWYEGYDAYNPHSNLFLRVKPEELSPMWMYVGPTLLPLSDVTETARIDLEKNSAILPSRGSTPRQENKKYPLALDTNGPKYIQQFDLTLIPWQVGELVVPTKAVELVWLSPEKQLLVLCPVAPQWRQESTHSAAFLENSKKATLVSLEPPSEEGALIVVSVL